MSSILKKATLNLFSKHLNPSSQVVLRADYNVPIKDGKVSDLARVSSNPFPIKKPFLLSSKYSDTTLNP